MEEGVAGKRHREVPSCSTHPVFDPTCRECLQHAGIVYIPEEVVPRPRPTFQSKVIALPSGAKPSMQTKYKSVASGERAMAKAYVDPWRDEIKSTDSQLFAWIYNFSTRLWTHTPSYILNGRMHAWLEKEITDVSTYIQLELRRRVTGDMSKEEAKSWKECDRKVQQSLVTINSLNGMSNIVKLALQETRDDGFVATLDSNRRAVSFENGVLMLDTLCLRPRTREDKLSYTLPYAFDAEASMDDVLEFVTNLYEDGEAVRAFQNMMGYLLTGETRIKRFLQWACPSNGGKTSILDVFSKAMGKYAAVGVVPAEEFAASEKFQERWSEILTDKPSPRWIAVDELKPDMSLNESLLNIVSDGTATQKLSLGRKHTKHALALVNHAKYTFVTNHVLRVLSASSGTIFRNTSIGLRFTFTPSYDADRAGLMDRPRNPALLARLLTPAAWPGILRFMALGAKRYYVLVDAGEEVQDFFMCELFHEETFKLRIRGDPYLNWLSENYVCTGLDHDHALLRDLVQKYRMDAPSAGTSASASLGLRTSIEAIQVLKFGSHLDVHTGVEQKAILGLRERRLGDMGWISSLKHAQDVLLM